MSKPIPWVKFEKLPDNAGRFVVSPLERGMGTTLGNSMRRVLLASLSGYAITSLEIDGVQHEFSTIPNVVEDVFDIICNLRGVIFKGSGHSPLKLKITQNGAGKVKAKDINCGSEVQIVNPQHHIAEVSKDGKLKIEMVLEKGTGYSTADENQHEGQGLNVINIDASFSPIVRVNHQVEKIRVGEELDYDSLVLDVWTNGSVTPEEAVKDASEVLAQKFQLFGALNQKPKVEARAEEREREIQMQSALELTIDDLELSARSSNCLKRAGIEKVGELIEKDLEELIKIKNFGKKSADEINLKLKQYGLALKGNH